MSSATRSSPTQFSNDPHKRTPKLSSRSFRLRSSSFSQPFFRRQKSVSHVHLPTVYYDTVAAGSSRRRPSFESNKPADSSLALPEQAGTSQQPPLETLQNVSSLLAVNDSISGAQASSVGTVSEDETADKEGPEILNTSTTDVHEKPLVPVLDTATEGNARQYGSITSTFRDKLSLSRGGLSVPKRSKSMFLRQARTREKDSLQDDRNMLLNPPPQKTDDSSPRDQYGFIKPTQWVSLEEYEKFERSYQNITHRRLQKWQKLLAENDRKWPERSRKIKRYVRKGIPTELRGQAWFHYSGAAEKKAANPGVYKAHVQKAEEMGMENEFLDIIERDLHRTFPDNIRFCAKSPDTADSDNHNGLKNSADNEVPVIQALRRLLAAFSVYSPAIGYCQSLNYIAGLLLLFMDEEDAFWTFTVIVHDILPPNIYDVTMEGANIDQTVLMKLISERFPRIWNRIGGGKTFELCEQSDGNGLPTTSLVTSHWFLTLYINILPIESVLRVWDCFFYEGQSALFRVALAIFRINEEMILSVDDSLEVFQVVQNMPKRMIDCHGLMDATYNKYASLTRITQKDLEQRRALCKARREQRRKISTEVTDKVTVGVNFMHKAIEARRLVARAKTLRR